MPTYEYECEACGHNFEIFQSMSAQKLSQCPQCKQTSLYRLIGTGTGVIFKGNGFYETDYKRKAPPAPATSKSETSQSESSKKTAPAATPCSTNCQCHN